MLLPSTNVYGKTTKVRDCALLGRPKVFRIMVTSRRKLTVGEKRLLQELL